jgi:aldehyde dehydrogenase (NAD+)
MTALRSVSIRNHTLDELTTSFNAKRAFFDAGQTKSCKFRLEALKKLAVAIKKYKVELTEAMYLDYKKPSTEAFIGDIGVVIEDLKVAIKELKYWMQDKYIPTPITVQPASSKIVYEPKGVVLIFGPWNYPFNLVITPLIGAIAAGNCVIIKPAHETPHTALLIEKMIHEIYPPEYVSVAMGEGKIIGEQLLNNFTFNHIFFTGSVNTGKWIMAQAARTLTPVTLELGGKCPAIIDDSVRLKTAIRRIVWAKYFNAGQTCLSTDYILVHESVRDKFITGVITAIKEIYGEDPSQSKDYGRIVNSERAQKIVSYLDSGRILHGGQYDVSQSYIAPTVMLVENLESAIMKEEIFGPIMPIIVWKNKEELVSIIRKNRYPLACYIFSEKKSFANYIINNIEFGGGCINNALAHFGNNLLPFGGVMYSGMGNYHGKHSFLTFSHPKPILKSASLVDLHIWYPPYSDTKTNLIEKVVG